MSDHYSQWDLGPLTVPCPDSPMRTAVEDDVNQDRHGSTCTSSTTAGTYAVDGDGLRESKTLSGTTTQFVWDGVGGNLLQQNNGTTKTSFASNRNCYRVGSRSPDPIPSLPLGPAPHSVHCGLRRGASSM